MPGELLTRLREELAERAKWEKVRMEVFAVHMGGLQLLLVPDGKDIFGDDRLRYLSCERADSDAPLRYYLTDDIDDATHWPRADSGHAEVFMDAVLNNGFAPAAVRMEIPPHVIDALWEREED